MSRATRNVMIENRRGLHARASMAFVTLASSQPVELTVEKDGSSASGTSILDLMMLGAAKVAEAPVQSDGTWSATVTLAAGRYREACRIDPA